MIYHGSIVPDLKVIEAKASTQGGEYVYGTPNMVTAAIFAISGKTGKSYPPKLFLKPGKQGIAERFENQFDSLKNMSISIYILDENNFKSFTDDPLGFSSGDDIELRASGNQEVKTEIKIENVWKFLEDNGVIFTSYKDRAKVGIPKTDKYFIQGILRTYLWKLKTNEEIEIARGDFDLEVSKQNFPHYADFIEKLKNIVLSLPIDDAHEFVEKFYNTNTDSFDDFFIENVSRYIEKNKVTKRESR